ncbi:hypothetical protein [Sphingomonas sp.]|uniref:hypothetical protein n=1 Tax=Sphingomonas sp. TaxID=28214 RepID=UPI0035C84A76
MHLAHDPALRATARVIYDTVYPTDDWAPVGFEEAERCRTIHYRQAVDAAIMARLTLAVDRQAQPLLL